MGGLFSSMFGADGQQSQGKVTQHDRAVLDLKVQRDKLAQYSKKIEIIAEKEKAAAAKLLKEGKREAAMRCLKKKKFQENLLHNADQMYMNLQQMVDSLEFAKVQQRVFTELKQGSDVLKALQKEMTIDSVEDMMNDTREAIEHQQEIDRMLSESLTPEDDEAVLKELEELTQEMPDISNPVAAQPKPQQQRPVAVPAAVSPAAPPPPRVAEPASPSHIDEFDELEALERDFVLAPTHDVKIKHTHAKEKPVPAALAE